MGKLSEKLITEGLTALDRVMGTSELLMSVAPIRIMVTGGAVAVLHLHTRPSTDDLDFVLDTNVDADADYRAAFFEAVRTATAAVPGLPAGWLNDHMRVFIRADKREELFLTSVAQGVVVYPGQNLVAYASRHDWALESKLSRLETLPADDAKRATDIADAVELVRLLNRARGAHADPARRLAPRDLRSLRLNNYTVPSLDRAIAVVAQAYKAKYGEDGILV